METWKDTNTICALCASHFLVLLWVSDCGTEFHIAQAFCWDCIARIVSIPPTTPPNYPQFRAILFICHVSSLDRGSTHGCPGAQGVEMWRADKRASVDRRLLCLDRGLGGCHGLRVNWSHGRHTVNLSWWYCVESMLGSIVNIESMHSVICVWLSRHGKKRNTKGHTKSCVWAWIWEGEVSLLDAFVTFYLGKSAYR